MVELASLASAHLSFACLHAAHLGNRKCRTRPPWFPRLARAPLWCASVPTALLSLWLMARVHPLYEAVLMVLVAGVASATLFVVLAALLPRVLWSLTAVLGLFVLGVLLGGAHG